MRRSVFVTNARNASLSAVMPQFVARDRRRALGIAALLGCLASSVMLTSCIQHSSSGSSNPLVVLVNNGSSQSAVVGMAFGAPLVATISHGTNPAKGMTVTFTAPSSGASGTFANGQTTETDTSDSNGIVTSSILTANSTSGEFQVAATASGAVVNASFALANISTSELNLSVNDGSQQSANLGASFTTALMVRVANNGTAIPGVAVTFTAPSSGASGTFANGTNSETDITDSNGLATSSTFTANDTPGQYQVTASVSGGSTPATLVLTNTSAGDLSIDVTQGSQQSATVGTPFGQTFQVRVANAGTGVPGITVTFTAPTSGASGTFLNGTNTESDVTDSSGLATASTFTANSTAGQYQVTATIQGGKSNTIYVGNTLNSASAAVSAAASRNTPAGTTAYTFYLSGQEAINFQNHLNFYALAGTILVDSNGNVIGGEEDYNDANGFTFTKIAVTGGSLSFANGDPAGQGTLTVITNNSQIGVSGTETFKVQFVNTNHALIVQFDDSGTASGTMDVQTLGNPSRGYAFTLTGVDPSYAPLGLGGVFVSSGTRSSTHWAGTIDVADGNPTLGVVRGIHFNATLGSMDSFGRGVMAAITVPINGLPPLTLNIAYYMVGPKALRLIDIDPNVAASGSAFAQGTNATSATNAGLGQSVFSVAGNTNVMNNTFFVTLGQFSTSNTSSPIANLTGVADEDELAKQFLQGVAITGTYQVQPNGYGSLSITSGNLGRVRNLGLYLTDPALNLVDPNNSSGGGGALLLDLDPALTGGIGIAYPQTDTSTNSFAGNYAVGWQDVNQLDGAQFPREFDMLAQGSMVANGTLNLTGVFSDPFETLTGAGSLSTGDTCNTQPEVDTKNLGSGRYSMLEANKPQNPLNCFLNFGTQVFQNFETIMYQASGNQLFWYQRSLQPLRPAQLFLGPVEMQGSLNGIPAASKNQAGLASAGTPEGNNPTSE